MLGGMMGGGGGKGGAGNDVSAGAMSAFRPAPSFAPVAYQPEAPNPALAPKTAQPAAAGGQSDQLGQMINKLIGVWADREKAQAQGPTSGMMPTAQPAPAAQGATQQTQDGWGPYTVPTPQHLAHYFQGEQPRG